MPALVQATRHEDGLVRWRAIKILTSIRDKRAIPAIRQVFQEGVGADVKYASQALMKLGAEEACVLQEVLTAIETQLQATVPKDRYKYYDPSDYLRKAYEIRSGGHELEIVYTPELGHHEERTETIIVPQGYGFFEAYGVEQTYTWNEWVVDRSEEVAVQKKEGA